MNSNENVVLSATQLSQVLKDELHQVIFGKDKEWTVFSKTDELIVKTHFDKNNNCTIVLTEGIIDAPPAICKHALGTIDAFKDLNPFCQAMNCLENLDERTDLVHAIFGFPIPITPREFCFYRYQSISSDPNHLVIVRSIDHPKVPENKNYVRGIFHTTGVLVEPMDGEAFKSRIYMVAQQELYIEDPKLSKAMEEINITFGSRVIPLLSEYIKNSGLNRQKQYLTKIETSSFREMMEIFAIPPDDKSWKKIFARQALEVWCKPLSNSTRFCTSGVFTIDVSPEFIFDFIRKHPPGTLDPFCRTMYQVEQITDTISIWYLSWKNFSVTEMGDAVLLTSTRLLPGGGYMILHRSVTHSRVPVIEGIHRSEIPPCGWFIHPAHGGSSSLVSYCIQGDIPPQNPITQEIEQDFAVRTMALVHCLRSLLFREQKNKELSNQIVQIAGTGSESVYKNDALKELLKLSHVDQEILLDFSPREHSPEAPKETSSSVPQRSMKMTLNAAPEGSNMEHLITVTTGRPQSVPSSPPHISTSPRGCPCNCWRTGSSEQQYFSLIKSSLLGCQVCTSKQSRCYCNTACQCDCSKEDTQERASKRHKPTVPDTRGSAIDLTKSNGESSQHLLPSIRDLHHKTQESGVKKFLFTPSSESLSRGLSEMEIIPNEIFLHIMAYLDHTSVSRLGQVNKRFRALSEERLLWKDFFLARCQSKLPKDYDEFTFDFRAQYRAIIQKSINWRRGYFTKQELQGHSKAIRCIEANSDYIVSGSSDKTVKVWDRKTGTCIRTFYANNGGVLGVSIDKKNTVSTGYRTGAVKTWNIASGLCTWEQNFGYYAEGFTFFDNKAAAWDFSIDIWDISTSQMERSLNQHTKKVNAVAIFNKPAEEDDMEDTKWLASGSADKTIKIWNLQTGECIRTFQGHSAGVTALDLNDKIVVSGSNDKVIRVWDTKTGNTLLPLKGHTGPVKCLKIYEDKVIVVLWKFAKQSKIISGSADNTVRIWTMKGDQHITLQAHQNITCLQVDNNQILAGCSDGTLIVWDFSAKETQQTV